MSEKKGGVKDLDLGLSALLTKEQRGGGAVRPQGDGTKPETEILTVEDDLEDLNAELANLAKRGQWGMLVSRAESAIASEEDIEARLWWIRGHLGAFTLPISLLAAPFETVCRQLVGDSRRDTYAGLLREIGDIALIRLRDVGDRRQEHSVRLALDRLGVIEMDHSAPNIYGAMPPKVPRFELGVAASEQPLGTVVEQRLQRPQQWRVRFAAGMIVCALLTVLFVFWRGRYAPPALLTAHEGLIAGSDGSVPGLMPPLVVARPVSSSLGALYYSMEKSESEAAKSRDGGVGVGEAQGSAAHDSPDSVTGTVPARAAQSERPPAPVQQKQRESVRTDGPIEGSDFTKGVERETVPRAKLPEVAPQIEPKPLPDPSYPDGSLKIGGEIKSALVRTEVYDSPSYQARVIARLVAGDKVSVEGRVGDWLRIRSRRGRAGFVSAQDIGELEEFNVTNEKDAR